MSRGPHTFKQCDVTRAIEAAKAAGLKSYRIEIDGNGKPVIVVGSDKAAEQAGSCWDEAIANLERTG
jgi:hypothetical protein